ncbi:SDR family oxidoreductase [Nocardia beijingensis]|uniref:SDR family NAD(P)-dependent oxidoreductase n=1 Tax=Nocardia beijingensis TaxID=95162 RepID=UPI00344E8113
MNIRTVRAVNPEWNRALVTGASAGIGNAFARKLAASGVDLVLVARDESRLQMLADELTVQHRVAVEVLPADLADSQSVHEVEKRLRSGSFIDVLVNNAGVGTFGRFEDAELEAELRTIDVNVVAPVRLTSYALERMRAEGRGTIITMSSLDALQPTPFHLVYGASKAFINSFFEALQEENSHTRITSTTVMPGLVRTEFTERAGVVGTMDRVPQWLVLSPEQVASAALADAAAGKTLSVPGSLYKAAAPIMRVLPRHVGRRIFGAVAPHN